MSDGGVTERSEAPVLKIVITHICHFSHTNITANMRPVARGCFPRLSGAMEFAKKLTNFSDRYSGIP